MHGGRDLIRPRVEACARRRTLDSAAAAAATATTTAAAAATTTTATTASSVAAIDPTRSAISAPANGSHIGEEYARWAAGEPEPHEHGAHCDKGHYLERVWHVSM